MEFLVTFMFPFLFGAVSAGIASARGRSAVGWFFAGFFAPCVGLIILLCLPDVKAQEKHRRALIAENRQLRAKLEELQQSGAGEAAAQADPEAGEAEPSAGAVERWFYAEDGERVGPVDFAELKRCWARGEIQPDSLLWTPGMADWARLDAIEGLERRLAD